MFNHSVITGLKTLTALIGYESILLHNTPAVIHLLFSPGIKPICLTELSLFL